MSASSNHKTKSLKQLDSEFSFVLAKLFSVVI